MSIVLEVRLFAQLLYSDLMTYFGKEATCTCRCNGRAKILHEWQELAANSQSKTVTTLPTGCCFGYSNTVTAASEDIALQMCSERLQALLASSIHH
eukprot:4005502-Amphidinium_carterae.1